MRALTIGLTASLTLSVLAAGTLTGCQKKGEEGPAAKQAVVAAPPATPPRKPGLWSQTMTTDNNPAVTLRICTDAEVEKKVTWWGGGMAEGACTENTATRNADGSWTFKAVCKGGSAGNSVTEGIMTGDMNTRYEIKGKTSTMGAASPGANGVHEVTMVAEYQGPCPADWLPGDTEIPGGMRMNTLAFEQIQKQIEAQGR